MVTYQQLRDEKFRPDQQLRAIAAQWSKLWRRLEDRGDDLHAKAKGLADHWEGHAYDMAAGKLRGLHKEIDATQAPLTTIDTELSALADDLAKAKGMLLDAEADAARIPATISADGTEITYIGDDFRPRMRKTIEARIQKVFDAIDDALDHANQADKAAAKTLAKLTPGYDPKTQNNGYMPKSGIPKPGTDPKKVNAWWDSLTPAEQQYLIHHHPDMIGRLDGVPVIYRDQANRVRLAREHEKAETREAQIEARLKELEKIMRDGTSSEAVRASKEADRLLKERDVVDRNIRGMKAIEQRLYDSPGKPRAYLIGFEPGTLEDRGNDGVDDTDGRAIIAIGNPDTADNVATYIPGTGSELGKVGGDIGRADTMAADTNEMSDDGDPTTDDPDTAVIMWLGYDAPDDPFTNSPAGHYADAASDDLRRFQDGLRATQEGERSHNTVIGHSYGSTVIGYTARDGAIHADELVFVGSPGVGVDRADGLGVDPHHVWATRAEHDVIKYVPDARFGTDPSHDSFGGQTFNSGPGDPNDKMGTHSQYWDDKQARKGMAGIITGNYDKVPGYTPTSPPDGPTPNPSPRPAPTPPR